MNDLLSMPLAELLAAARARRDDAHGALITYSPKVFIPLTRLCRDVCHYCTFATTPSQLARPYLELDEVVAIAKAGEGSACREALFTLGDRPESRYRVAREWLAARGYTSTIDYVAAAARAVRAATCLLPHVNAGVLSEQEYRMLRPVAASMGLMLESGASRLCERGGPHFGSPDKLPAVRLASLAAAGRARVPTTTGLLVGLGDTRAERLQALCQLRQLQAEHGHLQELIIQNFLPKADTIMRAVAPAQLTELQWTIAAARLVFDRDVSIQAPPNLNAGQIEALLAAGINDLGGISPVTPDHVNPEAPWPDLPPLARELESLGYSLVPRLTVYPKYIAARAEWLDSAVTPAVLALADADGYARPDDWTAGETAMPPPRRAWRGVECGDTRALVPRSTRVRRKRSAVQRIVERASDGHPPSADEIARLFASRGPEVTEVVRAADRLRRAACDDVVTYAINRNINYTNICTLRCGFCAFSKGRAAKSLRGPAYQLDPAQVAERALEAWNRGATEVCMQGGIHPSYTGDTYLELLRAVKRAVPDIHVHAFSPLEVQQGARSLGLEVTEYLQRLRAEGLGSLPGTAAEILDDAVRAQICPDKLTSAEWLGVVEAAHRVGLKTTATIMFGHLEQPRDWATHLVALRELQGRTGGITEFVPLPFVYREAPMARRGRTRPGPTWRESLLMHAVARIALYPAIRNVQASWVKLGPAGAAAMLDAGVNDLGGVLMDESISRAAGATHGQLLAETDLRALITRRRRIARQRTTLYATPSWLWTEDQSPGRFDVATR
ncbi:MAG: 5-amino-6-(D-ribitylamino)uracil--L-tyrosine 4-hydroxyphenyl transferase CofH [Steroidobacteraceae bacterium]